MTSPISAPTSNSVSLSVRRGFTLVEVLVVVGIIALLAGIALPLLLRASRTAARTRAAMDMQAITAGLDAYHQLFGDYPRPDTDRTGFIILGRALLGPDPESGNVPMSTIAGKPGAIAGTSPNFYIQTKLQGSPMAAGANNDWAPLPVLADGADGFGFRIRAGSGAVQGPFLDPGKVNNKNGVLLDGDDNPILYYVASSNRGKPDGSNTNFLFAGVQTGSVKARWDYNQNAPGNSSGTMLPLNNFRVMLGDANFNGFLDNGETARVEGPYFLWSAGGDLSYGPASTDKVSLTELDDAFNTSTGK